MTKSRLETFSDGVFAVVITITVLEIRVPLGSELGAARPLLPLFLAYVLSFASVGIYWNNHHHLMHLAGPIAGDVLWANHVLLFWLSLVPASTAWVGAYARAPWPTALYGLILFMAGVSWLVLQRRLLAHSERDSALARAVARDFKGGLSLLLYLTGVASAFWRPWVAQGIYLLVAVLRLVPDRRFERVTRPFNLAPEAPGSDP